MILFPLLASVIIARDGWREAWVVLGLLVWALALLPAWLLMAQGPEEVGLRPDGDPADPAEDSALPQDDPGWTLAEAMRTPALWILAAGTGLLFLVQAGTNTHAAAFFRDQGLDATTAGLAISLNGLPGPRGPGLGPGGRGPLPPLRYGIGPVPDRGHAGRGAGLLLDLRLRAGRDAHRASRGLCRLLPRQAAPPTSRGRLKGSRCPHPFTDSNGGGGTSPSSRP